MWSHLVFHPAHGARWVYVERVAHRVQRHRHFPLRIIHPVNHLCCFGPFLWWSTSWCGITATPAKGQNNTCCRHRKLLETVVHCYESGGASPIRALLLLGVTALSILTEKLEKTSRLQYAAPAAVKLSRQQLTSWIRAILFPAPLHPACQWVDQRMHTPLPRPSRTAVERLRDILAQLTRSG